MHSKIKKSFGILAMIVFGLSMFSFVIGGSVLAAPSSTPEEVLDTVVGETIDASVDLMSYVIQNYLKYILVLGIAFSLFYLFRRYSRIGSK